MKIEYIHASKFGNGATVAAELKAQMAAKDVAVAVHHIREVDPRKLPDADLYLFSSPGRFGKPKRSARRFFEKVELPADTPYALLTTEMPPQPDKKTGRMPTQEEIERWQRVRPILTDLFGRKGLVQVAAEPVYVTAIKGPLEDGWQDKVAAFATRLLDADALRNRGGHHQAA